MPLKIVLGVRIMCFLSDLLDIARECIKINFRLKSCLPAFVTPSGAKKQPEKHLPTLAVRQSRNVLARLRELQPYLIGPRNSQP